VIAERAAAMRERDAERFVAQYAPQTVKFDLPPPLAGLNTARLSETAKSRSRSSQMEKVIRKNRRWGLRIGGGSGIL
jgi:hypothetical protein